MRESSGTASNLSSLPSGGGGIAPLGDRFQPDLLRGSGSYAVPIHLPKGPNELQPNLSLTYSTGSGNGPLPMFRCVSAPSICAHAPITVCLGPWLTLCSSTR